MQSFETEENGSRDMPRKWYFLGPLVAVMGGFFGILAAGHENSGYGLFVAAFVVAPIVEEAVKPCGVYWLLGRRPYTLPSQKYIVFLAALAGLTFGIIESFVYVGIYYLEYNEHDQTMVIWRFTICLLVHTTCSSIVGFGINQKLVAWVRGEVPFLQGNRKFFFTAMAIHSAYNVFAWWLETNTSLFPD
ncbi:MAG: PrsW family intramembrane metalloprotease [Planctomycetes bacterium]|nr:PrsW family intramembrane metalloprotease [Planctomycetota bacterium]